MPGVRNDFMAHYESIGRLDHGPVSGEKAEMKVLWRFIYIHRYKSNIGNCTNITSVFTIYILLSSS